MASGRLEWQQHDRKEAALIEWAESLRAREDEVVRRELKLESKARDLEELAVRAKADQKALQVKLQRVAEDDRRLQTRAKELEDARTAVALEQEQSLRRAHDIEDRLQTVFSQEAELNAFKHHLQRQADKLEARRVKIKARRSQLKEAAEVMSLQQTRLDQGEQRIQQLHDDIQQLSITRVESEAQLLQLTTQIESKEQTLTAVETKLHDAHSEHAEAREKLQEKQQELQGVQSQLVNLQASVVSTSYELQRLTQQQHQTQTDASNADAKFKQLVSNISTKREELQKLEEKVEQCRTNHKQLEDAITKLEEQKASTLTDIEGRLELLRTQTTLFRQHHGGQLFPDLLLDSEMTPSTSLRFETSVRDSYTRLAPTQTQKRNMRQLLQLKHTCAAMRKDCARIRELQQELRQSAEMLFETKVASKLEHLKTSRSQELEGLKAEVWHLRQMKHEADVALRHSESDMNVSKQKLSDLEEALHVARAKHNQDLSKFHSQIAQQSEELTAVRAQNLELESNFRASLQRVSGVINALSLEPGNQAQGSLMDSSKPQDLFSRLIDGLEKLSGLAHRKEAYVQYLTQEQTSAEQHLSVLKADIIKTTEQLQTLQQEREDAEHAHQELEAILAQTRHQLHTSEHQLQHQLQLSHKRLMDVMTVVEQRKQEATALVTHAEEKFALLQEEQSKSVTHSNTLLDDVTALATEIEDKMGERQAKYLKKMAKAHRRLKASVKAYLVVSQHRQQQCDEQQQVADIADDIAAKRNAVAETLKAAEHAAAEIVKDAEEQAKEMLRQAKHSSEQLLAERRQEVLHLEAAIQASAQLFEQQIGVALRQRNSASESPARSSPRHDGEHQSVIVVKHHDMMRLQLAHLKQCRCLIAAHVLRNYCASKGRLIMMAVWFKWRRFAACTFQVQLNEASSRLNQRETDLQAEQALLDQKSNEVQGMLQRCQEAVALSRQKEADAAEFAKLENEHNRQTINDLTQQNTKLLARNDDYHAQVAQLEEGLAKLKLERDVRKESTATQHENGNMLEIPLPFLARNFLLPALLEHCQAFLTSKESLQQHPAKALVIDLSDMDSIDETADNYRMLLREGIAWLVDRLQPVELSVADCSTQAEEWNHAALRGVQLSVQQLRREKTDMAALVQQYRDAWSDDTSREVSILRSQIAKLASKQRPLPQSANVAAMHTGFNMNHPNLNGTPTTETLVAVVEQPQLVDSPESGTPYQSESDSIVSEDGIADIPDGDSIQHQEADDIEDIDALLALLEQHANR